MEILAVKAGFGYFSDMIKPALIFIAVFTLTACQPETYEECLLKNLKGIDGDLAATLVADACRKQFPLPENRFSSFAN